MIHRRIEIRAIERGEEGGERKMNMKRKMEVGSEENEGRRVNRERVKGIC